MLAGRTLVRLAHRRPLKPILRPKPSSSSSAAATPRRRAMAKSVDEADVGIFCYVSSLPGFRGVLKQRYSDFIVNEVGLDGAVVRLSSFDPPPEVQFLLFSPRFSPIKTKFLSLVPVFDPQFEEEKSEEIKPSSTDRNYAEEIESFRLLAGDANAELLKGFLDENDAPPIVLSPDPDKSHRGEVHNFFKKNFKFLVTDTIDGPEGDSKRIRVRFCSRDGGGTERRGRKRKDMGSSGGGDGWHYDSRGSDNWPEHCGKFLMFHLYKENKDTQEALGVIGKMLGMQQRSFGFAGTKDKRSISTQKVTIFKQYARRLAALNNRLIGIKLGDFCYVKEALVLGQLLGNRFTIILRGVVADSEDTIKAAAESLGRNGFINYYGLQRFGSGSVPTHLLGAALLRGEWKTAVGLILDPREGERAVVSEARQHYKDTNDVDMALRQFPRHLVAERAILQCLKKCPGNYLQALKAIPRTLRMMYVHSYQSYLWNHAASMRVQKHGIDQVVIGDLVYSKEGSHEKLDDNNIDAEGATNDSCDDSILSEISDASLPEEKVYFVKAINSEDLLKGSYTFEDVVLPLPGSRIQYPENNIAGSYHEMAKKDGISLRESVHGAKEFSIVSMTGSYRRIFQRPTDYVWELLTYTDGNAPLVETDLDIISKRRPADTKDGLINGNSGGHAEVSKSEITLEKNVFLEDGSGSMLQTEHACSSDTLAPKMALKLGFTLPSSCYATMAIRELLKTSTSVAYQKTLNQ